MVFTVNAPTGAFATGVLCDDYAYIYSQTYEPGAGGVAHLSYVLFHSGYGVASGINWVVQVSNDPNEDASSFYNYASGTIAGSTVTGVDIATGYGISRVGMRIDISGGTAVSGFCWVGSQ